MDLIDITHSDYIIFQNFFSTALDVTRATHIGSSTAQHVSVNVAQAKLNSTACVDSWVATTAPTL